MNLRKLLNTIIYSAAIVFFISCYILPVTKLFLDISKISFSSLCFAVIFFQNKTRFRVVPQFFLLAVPYLILSLLVGYGADIWKGLLHPMLLLWYTAFPAFLCYDIILRNNDREVIISIIAFFAIFLFVTYNTLDSLNYDENILRTLTSGAEGEDLAYEMALNNNGGFGFVYAAGAFLVGVFSILLNVAVNKIFKYAGIALLIVLSYFVLNAQFTTLLFLCLGFVAIILFKKGNTITKFIIILLVPLLFFIIPNVLILLESLYSGTTIGEHIQIMNESLFGNRNIIDMAGNRSRFMYNAFVEGLRSPFWGQKILGTSAGVAARRCHSVILSNFVATGIIGVVFKYRAIYYSAGLAYNNSSYILRSSVFKIVIMYYIVLSVLNPIEQVGDITITSFLAVPLIVHYLTNLSKKV